MYHNKFKLGLDLIMALGLLIIMVPNILGHAVHEWAGLIIAAAVIAHIVINWSCIKTITLRFFRHLKFRTRLVYILNLLMFLGFLAIVVSGMYISKTIDFSWLGINRSAGTSWKLIHTSSAYLTFLLAGVHIGINFHRMFNMIRPAKLNHQLINLRESNFTMPQMLLIIFILASGLYSFYSLDYLSLANPMRIFQAAQSPDQNNGTLPQAIDSTGSERPSSPSDIKQEPPGNQGHKGPPPQSGGGKSSSVTELLLFLGVLASTATATHLIDQAAIIRRCKVIK